jgi:hypothetical protein
MMQCKSRAIKCWVVFWTGAVCPHKIHAFSMQHVVAEFAQHYSPADLSPGPSGAQSNWPLRSIDRPYDVCHFRLILTPRFVWQVPLPQLLCRT